MKFTPPNTWKVSSLDAWKYLNKNWKLVEDKDNLKIWMSNHKQHVTIEMEIVAEDDVKSEGKILGYYIDVFIPSNVSGRHCYDRNCALEVLHDYMERFAYGEEE